jgi:hypothetical protein
MHTTKGPVNFVIEKQAWNFVALLNTNATFWLVAYYSLLTSVSAVGHLLCVN